MRDLVSYNQAVIDLLASGNAVGQTGKVFKLTPRAEQSAVALLSRRFDLGLGAMFLPRSSGALHFDIVRSDSCYHFEIHKKGEVSLFVEGDAGERREHFFCTVDEEILEFLEAELPVPSLSDITGWDQDVPKPGRLVRNEKNEITHVECDGENLRLYRLPEPKFGYQGLCFRPSKLRVSGRGLGGGDMTVVPFSQDIYALRWLTGTDHVTVSAPSSIPEHAARDITVAQGVSLSDWCQAFRTVHQHMPIGRVSA